MGSRRAQLGRLRPGRGPARAGLAVLVSLLRQARHTFGAPALPSSGARAASLLVQARLLLLLVTVGTATLTIGWASPLYAGTWSTSFLPTNCYLADGASLPALVDVNDGTIVPHPARSFASSPFLLTGIYCDVLFPLSVISNEFTLLLTFQADSSDVTENVCWQAAWEITLPGQAWGLNDATQITVNQPLPTAITSSANTDIRASVSLTAADMTNTPCLIGTTTGSCAGSHGLLHIQRAAQGTCPGDSPAAAALTRIELRGLTQ